MTSRLCMIFALVQTSITLVPECHFSGSNVDLSQTSLFQSKVCRNSKLNCRMLLRSLNLNRMCKAGLFVNNERSLTMGLLSSSRNAVSPSNHENIWKENLTSRLSKLRDASSIKPALHFLLDEPEAPIQHLYDSYLREHGVDLYIKREDLIHPTISGNKWRKLKYNLLECLQQGYPVRDSYLPCFPLLQALTDHLTQTLLTFGGAYSNHIAATAAAGARCGLRTVGIIRGGGDSEGTLPSPTLRDARAHGMSLEFVSRAAYRELTQGGGGLTPAATAEFARRFGGPVYVVPEGGANDLALCGCAEMMRGITSPRITSPRILAAASAGAESDQVAIGRPRGHDRGSVIGRVSDGGDVAGATAERRRQKGAGHDAGNGPAAGDCWSATAAASGCNNDGAGGAGAGGAGGRIEEADGARGRGDGMEGFDCVAVACGTGSTLAGIAAGAAGSDVRVIGFPVLKGGDFIKDSAKTFLYSACKEKAAATALSSIELELDYHFGGYAKVGPELVDFMRRFEGRHGVRLDPVYTAKLLAGIYDLAGRGRLAGQRVLAVHTGGMQGLEGIEARLGYKIYSAGDAGEGG